MKTEDIAFRVDTNYCYVYKRFREFYDNAKYSTLWHLCMETLENRNKLVSVVMCNDLFELPPVKTFLEICREDIENLKEDDYDTYFVYDDKFKMDVLKLEIKQYIGAFWGCVFKTGFEGEGIVYTNPFSVAMVRNNYYGVATASCFKRTDGKRNTYLIIE